MSATSAIETIGKSSRYLANVSDLALAIGCGVVMSVVTCVSVEAASLNWTGTASSDWYAAGNWNSGTVPLSTDSVTIDATVPNSTLISGGTATAATTSVGFNSTGALTITNSATFNSGQTLIGRSSGSSGTVTISGLDTVWMAEGLVAGNFGTGTLSILNGAVVDTQVWGMSIADQASGNGAIIVDGAGSILRGTEFVVGYQGTGALTVSNGGTVNATTWSSSIGERAGAVGVATVTGIGSQIIVANSLAVGNFGTGTLNVLNGGLVDASSSEVVVAAVSSGVGAITVNGAGSKLSTRDIIVGANGVGTMTVSNGGIVTGDGFLSVIGQAANSVGSVTVTGPGSQWTIKNNGMIVGENGNATLTIADGGVVTPSFGMLVGTYAGSVATINIGGGVGAPAVAPGTLDVKNLYFGVGSSTINFNHTGTGYTFDAEMVGNGTINQRAGVTIITADSKDFSGATNVTGGRLAVNGSLFGSVVTVSGGGILGGTGTVGGIVATSGGIVGPGNSIGTLNVAGNVTFAAGSIYQVETNAAGQSDKIAATGTATLNGGTVMASGVAPLGTTYTILTAGGGISGVFAGASGTSTSPFLSYGLSYDATNVYLSYGRSSLAFAAAGLTRNQIAAGRGADSLPLGSPLVGSLVQLDLAQARAAFDQLSGEVHASAKGVMIEDSRFVREAAIDRLRSAFDGVGVVAAPVTAYVDGRPVVASANTDHLVVWGRGFGSWGQWNGDGNAATVKRDIGGFMIGADAPSFDGWRLGMIGGYSRSNFRVADRSSSSTSDNYHIGLYGGAQWGDLAFRSGLAFTRHDLTTSRTVAFPGFTDMLKADYGAGTTQGFGELGYSIRAGRTALGMLAFEPFGNLAYVHLTTDGLIEKGGNAALTGRSDDTGVTFTTLGVRSSLGGQLDNGMTTLVRGTLSWRHAFGDVTPVSIMAFSGGSQFGVAGVPIARNGAVVDVGFDVNVTPDAVWGLSYGGQLGSGVTDHSLRGNFAVRF